MHTTLDLLRRHAQLQDALLKTRAEQSLGAFVEEAWAVLEPDVPFISNWHIDLIVEHLEAITAGENSRLLINIPPRYMKSLLVSVMWPVWEWIQRPGGRWIFSSYSESLSLKHSLDRRSLLRSDWFQGRWGDRVSLLADQNLKGEFTNTRRGSMIATSTGGSITGKGGNRIVIDDPHNPTQAESDLQRERANDFFRRTLSTRLNNKKRDAIVVVMQRLHERDLSALCKDAGFTTVCLPAEAEDWTVVAFPRTGRRVVRDPGNLLWETREGRKELDEQKRMLGSSVYAGQYQQDPAPAGGAIFNRDGFRYYNELPDLRDFAHSWDMSFKDGKDCDYVVGLVAGRRGADMFLIDRAKGQWSFSETCRQVQRLCDRHPSRRIFIEDAANGPAIVDALSGKIGGITPVRPEGGKVARAYAAQPLVEAGNVHLPNPRPHGVLLPERAWVDDFVYQLQVFPRGAHDDDVDAFTQLVTNWKARSIRLTW